MTVTIHPDGRMMHGGTNVTPSIMVDSWRLSSNITNDATLTSANGLVRTSNLNGRGTIGPAMSVDSSGKWTFPLTGVYLVIFKGLFDNRNADTPWNYMSSQSSTDGGSSYTSIGDAVQFATSSSYRFASCEGTIVFNVTNTSTHHLKFNFDTNNSSSICMGNARDDTTFKFIRMADI
tara:strand:- start:74 stop:604 length:531 start_codon:yes stop_codon:yes gene_type:complete